MFHAAIKTINLDPTLLPNTKLVARIENVQRANSYASQNRACSILQHAPVAIFGPFDEVNSMQVQSICENFEIPHLGAKLVTDDSERTLLSLNLHPPLRVLSQVFQDLVVAWEWKKFAIVYSENQNVIHFSDFLARAASRGWEMKVFQLLPDRSYREVLWQVKASKITNIILDVRLHQIEEVLQQAQQVGILTEQHNYLITTLDLHTLDLDNYRHSMTNITSLRIVQEDHPELRTILEDWDSTVLEFLPDKNIPRPKALKSESAMIWDGMKILAKALQELNKFEVRSIDCNGGEPWPYGTTLINYLRQVKLEGLTGMVEFDTSGFRSPLSFDIISTVEAGIEVIGQWRANKVYTNEAWKKHSRSVENLKLIRVTTILNDPFVMNTKNSKELKGNDRYEGFVPDMLNEISKLLNVRFVISLVKDGAYGAAVNATDWNGLVGEVIRGEADIAAADLTINSNREVAVDFTYPFMSTGISIIYKKPTTKETSLWSFLSPFSKMVWVCLIAAFVGISLILFYVGRFTPYEWSDPFPCVHHEPVLENNLNTRNSFWCTIGSLMQQGSDVAPK